MQIVGGMMGALTIWNSCIIPSLLNNCSTWAGITDHSERRLKHSSPQKEGLPRKTQATLTSEGKSNILFILRGKDFTGSPSNRGTAWKILPSVSGIAWKIFPSVLGTAWLVLGLSLEIIYNALYTVCNIRKYYNCSNGFLLLVGQSCLPDGKIP